MCTAVTFNSGHFYFGRTLDYDFSYSEKITVTPRNYAFKFRNSTDITNHFAIIGMAYICDDYPLYYDAVNEKGLCMAGLNFVGNAVYNKVDTNKTNIAQFELIPWILSQCVNVKSAIELLLKTNITDTAFSDNLPVSQLHWIIADKDKAITVEAVKEGLKIYDNPIGVLTNNPPFPEQMSRLNDYMHLSPKSPSNLFSDKLKLNVYSRGMGALGLPGDLSSGSRFIRAGFTKMNCLQGKDENGNVGQFFHILETVNQTKGCCIVGEEKYEITIYTSCCNADKGIYYYTTYNNRQINAVNMYKENLDSSELISFTVNEKQNINMHN